MTPLQLPLALVLALAGSFQPAGAPKQPVFTPVDKPPFDAKLPTSHAEKAKQMREAAQKRFDTLKERWDTGYKTEGKALPALKFEEPVKNLGKVTDDAKIDIVFKFTNVSDQTVTVKSAKPGCGCTVAKLEKETFAPGESGSILATFNPQNRRSLEFKDIDVTLDAKDAPNIKIGFLVDTLERVALDPVQVNLGELRKGGSDRRVISVVGREPGFDVPSFALADSAAPFTVTRLDKAEEDDESGGKVTRVRFEVALKPGQGVAQYNTNLTFTTSDPKRPTVSAPLIAKVVGDLRTTPDRVFVVGDAASAFTREIRVEHRNAKSFKLLGVQTDGMSPGFGGVLDYQAADSTGAAGEVSAYSIKFSGSLPATGGGAAGKIIVLTDDPDQPRIEIPVQGMVASVKR